MSVTTGISRITGFLRGIAMAWAVGVTLLSSNYVVSNNIPNMIYELVAGGVLSSVFIPIFIERTFEQGQENADRLGSSALNVVLVLTGVVALIATIFPQPFVWTQTFLSPAADRSDAIFFFRFFAIQIVFYGAAAIFTGILNSRRHFIAPAAGPIFNNLVVIATMVLYVLFRGTVTGKVILGVGTTLGVVAQMAVMIPVLIQMKWRWQLVVDWHDPALRRLAILAGPVLGYVIMNLIAVSFRNTIALKALHGGPAALNYAWVFYQLPYGVFAVALATAVFPELSDFAARKDWDPFKRQLAGALRATAALIIPCAAMLVALAVPLSRIYVRGAFTTRDVYTVSGVLVVWAIGLFSFSAFMLSVKGFYAVQDTKTPMIVNFFATLVQVGLYWFLTLGVFGWPGLGLPGIPWGDAISYSIELVALLAILRGRLGALGMRSTVSSIARITLASIGGGLVAWEFLRATDPLLHAVPGGFLLQIAAAGALGLAAAYAFAVVLRVEEVRVATSMVRRVVGRLIPRNAAA